MAFQARLLNALADPTLSLREVADRLGLPLDQLSLVMCRPDLASEIAALDSLAATRIRLVATSCLPAAANTARKILDDFNSPAATNSSESALRAARLLLRLANFTSGPVVVRAARAPRATDSGAPRLPATLAASTPFAPILEPADISAPPVNARSDSQPTAPTEFADNPPPPQSHASDSADSFDPSHSDQSEFSLEDSLTDEQVLSLAADLLQKGAFSQDQIDEAFRIAAAEMRSELANADINLSEPDSADLSPHQGVLAGAPP